MLSSATIFKFDPNNNLLTAAEIAEALSDAIFAPCMPSEEMSTGFIPPREENGALVESVAGQYILKVMIETKSIPGSLLAEKTAASIKKIEDETGRKPGKKECKTIKDAVRTALITTAFTRRKSVLLWIDPLSKHLYLDGTSKSVVDEVVSLMCKFLPTMSMTSVWTAHSPSYVMGEWLKLPLDETSGKFSVERSCELVSKDESKAIVKFSNHHLMTTAIQEQIKLHIESGKQVESLALSWDGRISFVLCEDLCLKKINILDSGDDKSTDADAFDATVAIYCGTIAPMFKDLMEALGGERV